MKATSEISSTVTGMCAVLIAAAYARGVGECSASISQHAMTAVQTAAMANARLVLSSRSRHQTGRWTAASVRHAAAIIDHTTVTVLTRLHLRQQLDAEV